MQMWILYDFAHSLRPWSEDFTMLCRGVDGWALLLRESVCEPWEDDIRQGHLAYSRYHHPSKFNNSLHVLSCDWTSTLHFTWSAKNFRGSPDFPMISLYILTQTCLWWPSVDSLWPQTSSPFCYTQTAQGKSFHNQLKFSLVLTDMMSPGQIPFRAGWRRQTWRFWC
jgi:hypothetical protein